MKFDLHTHSTASDGQLPPAEVVRMAAQRGITLMALADHDTAAGVDAAMEEARRCGVRVIPAIELSSDRHIDMHILGYGIDHHSDAFARFQAAALAEREARNNAIIPLMQKAGYQITAEDCEKNSAGAGKNWGRAHIARVLVEKGYFDDVNVAFAATLVPGAPTYVPRKRLPPEECIRAIHSFGGLAVWAHPIQVSPDTSKTEELLNELTGYGLDGLEVFYPQHDEEHVLAYYEMAQARGLYMSFGSDFHGPARKGHDLLQNFELFAPESAVRPLIDHLMG